MLSFGCVGYCADALVGQGGCRLTAFEPFKRRIFVVILYWTVSQHLPLNPIRTLLYICTVIKTGCRTFPEPYSLQHRKLYCCCSLRYRFLSNREHLKNLISILSASCCYYYCSIQRPVVGPQPGVDCYNISRKQIVYIENLIRFFKCARFDKKR